MPRAARASTGDLATDAEADVGIATGTVESADMSDLADAALSADEAGSASSVVLLMKCCVIVCEKFAANSWSFGLKAFHLSMTSRPYSTLLTSAVAVALFGRSSEPFHATLFPWASTRSTSLT